MYNWLPYFYMYQSQTTTPSKVTTGNAAITVTKSGGSTSGNTSTTSTTTSTGTTSTAVSSAVGQQQKPELKPVECNLCHRKFKNIPALNGHMRLHGGYFKKDAENKKCEKKENSGPPLQTASVSVRALIEEKIIQKRTITNPTAGDAARNVAPPLYPLTVHSSETDAKVTSFVVPAPPQPPVEKARRHSDAETFTVPRAPPCQSPALPQDADALGDLILKRGKVTVKRATSDPGQPSAATNQNQQIQLQFQPGDGFTLASVTYQAEEGGYFSPSLQDEVFHQVQDTMLLQSVDAQQLASIQFQAASLLQEQDEQLQDIASLEDYATVTASLHDSVVDSTTFQSSSHSVNQELQAVLDSPLPDSLADFSTFHSNSNMADISSPNYQTQSPAHRFTNSPHTSLATQSPLQSPLIRNDSPGFAYPTPPASHEGPSPSFTQTSLLPLISPQTADFTQINRDPEEPPQASSPLSAAFFTSTMSSAAAVEEALEEVLPGESIAPDDIYPSLSNSPPPQSPISVAMTPVPSPLSNVPTSTASVSSQSVSSTITFPLSPHYTLQSQMMPNSDDPLLSSSPKDFTSRKKFEFNTIQNIPANVKVIGNGYINFPNQENLTGILVDSNGELKFIQTGGNPIHAKNIIVTGATIAQNTATVMIKQEQDIKPNITLSASPKAGQKINKINHHCIMAPSINRTHSIRSHKLPIDNIKQEETDVFVSPSIIPASPSRASRKRPRSEPLNVPHNYQSRLRAARGKPPGSAPYTPPPILNPSRQSSGLFWDAVNKSTIGTDTQSNGSSDSNSDLTPESDSTPHINVGNQYQCSVPDFQQKSGKDDGHLTEHLLWNPKVNYLCTDNEVDMYLDFACCAAVPGGGRNKEYALHLLHMCGGNIHEAMIKLMQPTPFLPTDHPLLHYEYSDSDQWSATETESFHQAIQKHDKDFFKIAKDVGTKTVKQCVQFYYIWKKVCTDEYRRLRLNREQRQYGTCLSMLDIDIKEEKDLIDSKLGITDIDSQMSVVDSKSFTCEFHECSASFNSRAALNGHIRIHGGTVRRSPTPTQGVERRLNLLNPTSQQTHHHHHHHPLDPADAEYPCKICGKVFSKIKSRSAHMKSHRPPDAEPKRKTEYLSGSYTSDPSNIISSPATHAH